MKIIVDGTTYPSKKKALAEFRNAIYGCEGSEQSRMSFAYWCIVDGYTNIDTYMETAK